MYVNFVKIYTKSTICLSMMLEEEMVIQDTIPHLIYEILTKYRTPQLFVPPPKIMQGGE